jgi:pimeloyl-ACP methyl ester carboxylesterase
MGKSSILVLEKSRLRAAAAAFILLEPPVIPALTRLMESHPPLTRPARFPWLGRLLRFVVVVTVIPLGLMVGCQGNLIYFPRAYPAGVVARWQQQSGGKLIDFKTSQGRQRAFLQGNLTSARRLWIVCGGNGTVALDWSDWLASHAPKEDAWLLVDFPGYGDCQGSPNPARIRESFTTGLPVAFAALGWENPPEAGRLRFFGHSLGAAACLIAATEFKIQRGVLLAPFTSTMDMSRALTGLPLGFLVWHRYDNAARLAELSARGPGKVIILHGTRDEVIPVAMSRTLAAQQQGTVRLREIPDGRHNTIQAREPEALAKALSDAGN